MYKMLTKSTAGPEAQSRQPHVKFQLKERVLRYHDTIWVHNGGRHHTTEHSYCDTSQRCEKFITNSNVILHTVSTYPIQEYV